MIFCFFGTTISTGKQKQIWGEVPALQGLLYSYKQSFKSTKAQTVHIGSFGPLLGSYAGLEGSLTRVRMEPMLLLRPHLEKARDDRGGLQFFRVSCRAGQTRAAG